MFCPACLFLKILEFVTSVYRLLAAVHAGLSSERHAVVSRSDPFISVQTTWLPASWEVNLSRETRTQTDSNGERENC